MTQQRNNEFPGAKSGTLDLPEAPAQDKAAQGSAAAAASQGPVSALPLFYKAPIALDANVHREAGILPDRGLNFAHEAIAIPLLISEFAAASRHYPIVFTGDADSSAPITPLAVVGLRAGQNLFIESDGQWKAGVYVPAYVRRYPFIVSETADKSRQVILVDSQADSFVANVEGHSGAWRIFAEDGKPTAAAQRVIDFCRDWYVQANVSADFSQALRQEQLLAPNIANFQLPGGAAHRVDGFAIVDQARLRAVSDATVLDWIKRDWYALIVMHLVSQQNWANLMSLDAQAHAPKAAA